MLKYKEIQYNNSMKIDQIVNQIIEERTAEALADCKGDRASAYAYVIGQLQVMLATAADLAVDADPGDVRTYLKMKLRKSPQGRAVQTVEPEKYSRMGYGGS